MQGWADGEMKRIPWRTEMTRKDEPSTDASIYPGNISQSTVTQNLVSWRLHEQKRGGKSLKLKQMEDQIEDLYIWSWKVSSVLARKIKPPAEGDSGHHSFLILILGGMGNPPSPRLSNSRSNCVLGDDNLYNLSGSKIPNVHTFL